MIYQQGKRIPIGIKEKWNYYGRCKDKQGTEWVFWTNSLNHYKKLKKNKIIIKLFDEDIKMKMIKGVDNYKAQVIKRLERDG